MSRLQGTFFLFGTSIIWGLAFVAQSTGMDSIEPFTFLAVRFLLGGLVLLPFAYFEWRKLSIEEKRVAKKWVFILGVILFGGAGLQQVGLLLTTVTNAGFLTSLYVPLVPILLLVIFRTKPHFIVWPAVVLSFAGTFLISGGSFGGINQGDLLQIIGAFFWAGHIIAMGFAMSAIPKALIISCGHFFVVSIIAFFIAFSFESPAIEGIIIAAPELLFTGVLSSGLAFFLQAVGQKSVPPSQATLIMAMEAVFAAIGASLILGEQLLPIAYIGCALIFVATLLVEIVPEIWKGKKEIP